MTTTLIELTPNRALLDSNFDGYKLSLQEITQKKKGFANPVDKILLSSNQYSLLHAKLFGLHNHLIGDEFDENVFSVYFIDNLWNVCKTYVDPLCNELIDPVVVWTIPKQRERKLGDYNVSLKFVTKNLAVASDGTGILYIINTGDRDCDDTFSVCFSDEVAGPDEPFLIIDAVYKQNASENEYLHILLLNIKQDAQTERFSSVLHWITLTKNDGSWGETALKQLKTNGNVQYAAVERECEAVYIVSDNGCKFTLNSDCPVSEELKTEPVSKTYKWSQNLEDVTIKIPLPENASKDLVYVKSEPTNIEIKYDAVNVLAGELYQSIDSDMTTWTIEQNLLEITLSKTETGSMWTEIVKGDQQGEYIVDTSIVEQAHERLSNLCSNNEALPKVGTTFNSQQVEECDFESDKSTAFERLSGTTNKCTHKINFGSHQVLMTLNLIRDLPPAIGVRHDVDVCLWQPQSAGDNFSITHEGTLLAFGYVQASKQNRKFSVCPSDMSYAVICESSGHIFLYRQKKLFSTGELKNRATGRRIQNIAEQQVLNMYNNEILGIYPTSSTLFLLCEKSIIALVL